ncbi:hypothetical protein [Streptomyces sp. NPDC055189]
MENVTGMAYEAPEVSLLGDFAVETGEGQASKEEWGYPVFDWVYHSLESRD